MGRDLLKQNCRYVFLKFASNCVNYEIDLLSINDVIIDYFLIRLFILLKKATKLLHLYFENQKMSYSFLSKTAIVRFINPFILIGKVVYNFLSSMTVNNK